MKTLFVIISAFSLVTASHAGEMTVTGSAKATYNITSGKSNVGKGIGVANELAFTATGEIDNGYTWKAQIELDPTDGVDSVLQILTLNLVLLLTMTQDLS